MQPVENRSASASRQPARRWASRESRPRRSGASQPQRSAPGKSRNAILAGYTLRGLPGYLAGWNGEDYDRRGIIATSPGQGIVEAWRGRFLRSSVAPATSEPGILQEGEAGPGDRGVPYRGEGRGKRGPPARGIPGGHVREPDNESRREGRGRGGGGKEVAGGGELSCALRPGKFQGAGADGGVSPLDKTSLYADNAGRQITRHCPEVLSHSRFHDGVRLAKADKYRDRRLTGMKPLTS